MKNKKGSTVQTLAFVIVFWSLIILFMSFVDENLVYTSDDIESYYEPPETFTEKLTFMWNIATFQIQGVPFWITILIDAITMIGVLATVALIRGV